MSEILIGVSACLLGERIRYDAGHNRCRPLVDQSGFHEPGVR
jgi:uncharacterized protein YbbK (DUF523 family)